MQNANAGVGSLTYKFSQIERNVFVQEMEHDHRNCILGKSLYLFLTAIFPVWMLEGQGENQFLTNKEKYQQ